MTLSQQRFLNFPGLLDPISPAAFLEQYLGRKMLHIPGAPEKLEYLLSWNALSNIITYGQLPAGRFRLMRNGEVVPFDSYLRAEDRKTFQLQHLSAMRLGRHLREGATLVLDSVDYLHAPILFLAQSLERALNRQIQVNLYAGWRESPGLKLHWDRHDALILQISGRKHWQIYGETRRFPLDPDLRQCEEPVGDPVWDGMLSAGDILYIPRGWWHIATPCDEPTLHLTVGLRAPTGVDMAYWFAEQMKAHEVMRQDLPVCAGPDEIQGHLSKVMRTMIDACNDQELLGGFFRSMDASASSRNITELSLAVTEALPSSDSTLICLMTPRRLKPQPAGEGEASILFEDKSCSFLDEALVLLTFLESAAPIPIGEFYQEFESAFGRDVLQQFLLDLAQQGIIVFQEQRSVMS